MLQCRAPDGSELKQGHEADHLLSQLPSALIQHRNTTMDDILDSLSRQGRKLKNRLRGKKHKPDRLGANTPGESARSSGSLLQPELRVAASSHDGEGSGIDTDVRKVRPKDQSPQSEPVPAASGSNNDRQRKKADIEEREVSQRYSHLDPDVEVAVGGGPSREVERVYPSSSPPSLPPTGKPDGTP